jgi:hypothetical protein
MALLRNGFVQPIEGVSGGVPVPVTVSGGAIVTAVTQVQNTESVAPLGAGASVAGASRDCINYESFGISVFLTPQVAAALNATALVENSRDGVTWRTVDSVPMSGAAGVSVALNRVYSVTREFYRVSVTNNDGANALLATEVISMQKPI